MNLELKRQAPRSNRKGFYYQEITEPPSSSEAARLKKIELMERYEDAQWDALKSHIESGILPTIANVRRSSGRAHQRRDKKTTTGNPQYVPFLQERDDLGRLITPREQVEAMMSTNAKKPPLPTVYQMQKKWENKKPEKESKYSVDINKRIVHSKDTVSAHINLSRSKLQIEIPHSESEADLPAVGTLDYSAPPMESTATDGRFDYGLPEGYEGPLTDLRQKVYRNDPPYSGYGGNLAF